MNFEHLFAAHAGKTVRVGLAGAGEFGRSFLFRSGRVKGLQVVALADRDMTDVAPGTLIARHMVEPPAGSALWRLRGAQDARFFP